MNKIAKAFTNKKAFISFLTAGDPDIKTTEKCILALVEGGCDLIEIGIPFSDPIAEGPVIERANERALAAGTLLPKVFELVRNVRLKTDVPLVFLTYINPIFVYGGQKFFLEAKAAGIDGIIIPDLPFEELGELATFAQAVDIPIISLVAPTSNQRIPLLVKESKGFVYLVSSMGVTGVRSTLSADLASTIATIRANTKTPIAIGFGIATPEQVSQLKQFSDGVIIGSAIVKIIEKHGENAPLFLLEYAHSIRRALDS
ncbi:MAG: tryptophan synthase subunit alpha [Culicoidibacterales bacterium]